jgi:ZIP family zinc transporter
VDRLVPKPSNPHETREEAEYARLRSGSDLESVDERAARRKLGRTGLVTALAIGIHNFPEGMATFFASLESVRLGAMIAVAIALHNIPEGISVSVPIYYATRSRKKAFIWSGISGLAEPVGAALALAFMAWLNQPALTGIMFAGVAGIMVFISLDELLPTARAYSTGHETVYGLIAGMAVMALSLLLLK